MTSASGSSLQKRARRAGCTCAPGACHVNPLAHGPVGRRACSAERQRAWLTTLPRGAGGGPRAPGATAAPPRDASRSTRFRSGGRRSPRPTPTPLGRGGGSTRWPTWGSPRGRTAGSSSSTSIPTTGAGSRCASSRRSTAHCPRRPRHAPAAEDATCSSGCRLVGSGAGPTSSQGSTCGETAGRSWRHRLTDVGNADRLAALHGPALRYCAPWRAWNVWDGRRWARDATLQAQEYAKDTVRSIFGEASQTRSKKAREKLATHALKSDSAPGAGVRGCFGFAFDPFLWLGRRDGEAPSASRTTSARSCGAAALAAASVGKARRTARAAQCPSSPPPCGSAGHLHGDGVRPRRPGAAARRMGTCAAPARSRIRVRRPAGALGRRRRPAGREPARRRHRRGAPCAPAPPAPTARRLADPRLPPARPPPAPCGPLRSPHAPPVAARRPTARRSRPPASLSRR